MAQWLKAPTLTTHNDYLFVFSVSDVVTNVEDSSRQVFRFLTGPERLILQGFPAKVALKLPQKKLTFASGNSYPIPLIVATLYPMLRALADSSFDLLRHPQPNLLADNVPEVVKKMLKDLGSPGRIVNTAKRQNYLRQQKRKRKGSGSAS